MIVKTIGFWCCRCVIRCVAVAGAGISILLGLALGDLCRGFDDENLQRRAFSSVGTSFNKYGI